MQLFSLSNLFLTFLVILSLILNSFGFLSTHNEPVPQTDEPPDPFEMLMGDPSPILESAPDFEELQNQINPSDELDKVNPQIKLDLTPALIIPGEPFLVSWELNGIEELEKLTTSDAYLSINPSNAVQLSADQILPSQLEILAKDDGSTQLKTVIQNISGQISWNLDTQKVQDNEQQYLALYLMDGENILISQAVALKPATHLISKDSGGTITSFDERVTVTIPTEALDENV